MTAATSLGPVDAPVPSDAPDRAQPLRRPSLELVRPSSARLGRTPFVAVVLALLATGLLGLLVLNTALAQDAFRLHKLKAQARELQDREQLLQREVEALRAPQALAARAEAQGMVRGGPPAFLRLPDGAVLGAQSAAEPIVVAPEAPTARIAEAVVAAEQEASSTDGSSDDSTDDSTDDDSTDESTTDETPAEDAR